MAHGRWVGIALATAALLSSAPAAADHVVTMGDVTVEFRDGAGDELDRVVGRSADGAELWSIERCDEGWDFIAPTIVDGRLLYACFGDLLELDATRGQIVNRWRFPGRIVELAAGDEPSVVKVTVDDDAAWSSVSSEEGAVSFAYRLGDPVPGRSPWGMLVASRTRAVGEWQSPDDERGHSADEVAERLAAAQGAEQRDPTNPYLAYAVGRWLLLADRPADAHAAFMRAAMSDRAPWSDFFYLAAMLQPHDAAAARAAFDNGYQRMLDAGVRPERMQTVITSIVLVHKPHVMKRALANADVELVHELATRHWKVQPKLEGGPLYWRVLATWFAEHDRTDLEAVWDERAEAAKDGWLNRLGTRIANATDLAAPIVAGMLFGVVFAAFLVGLRLRRAGGWRMPASAVATVVTPLLLAMVFAAIPSAWIFRNATLLFPDDCFDAPSVVQALAERPPSAERDEVLAWARAESAATLAGQRHDGPMPGEASIAEAIMPTPSWSEGLASADQAIAHVLPDWKVASPAYVDHWLEFLLVLLVPLLLGLALARFLPSAARWVQRIVPGGVAKLSIAGGAVFGLFTAAALVVFGGYTPFWDTYGTPRSLGLDEIWRDVSPGPSLWWYVPLIAIPLIQGVLVWRELRSER